MIHLPLPLLPALLTLGAARQARSSRAYPASELLNLLARQCMGRPLPTTGIEGSCRAVAPNYLPELVHTSAVKAQPDARPPGAWRSWSIWLPGTLALAWSGLLIIADGLAGVMGSWDTPPPGLYRWVRTGVIGHCVLVAASALTLAVGLRFSSRRRPAAITAWIIIPVGLGWFLLTGRFSSR